MTDVTRSNPFWKDKLPIFVNHAGNPSHDIRKPRPMEHLLDESLENKFTFFFYKNRYGTSE
jgi:hypothetical protein